MDNGGGLTVGVEGDGVGVSSGKKAGQLSEQQLKKEKKKMQIHCIYK